MTAPVLVFGYGNPSRGDDALGPAFLERIEALRASRPDWPAIECQTDFQLQVEHALDLKGRERVLFVDASASASAPFTWDRIEAGEDASYTTHSLEPRALLGVYERLTGETAPASFVLGIHGERFELGEPLSAAAQACLEEAIAFAAVLFAHPPFHPKQPRPG